MAKVVLENVSKTFKGARGEEVHAVQNVSLTVEDKEFLVLVGPSGCGKSTTLRLIAGLEEVTTGCISIADQAVNNVPPQERDIAMVFQNYALYPHLTAFENMALGLKLRKIPSPEIERRVRETADMLGLASCLDRLPKALSGGQRQRVAVGRAIVRQPKVFLFDEPLSNLDAPMRGQLRAEISRLHIRLRATIIYVTHDQVEAMTMGDRIAVMNGGVILQVATPMELYRAPANLFVAGFMGSPPMNLFKGTLLPQGGGLHFLGRLAPGDAAPEDLLLRLSSEQSSRLARYAGQSVVIGLRPENILHLAASAGESEHAVTATVELVEPMGGETLLHGTVGGQRFIARLPAVARTELNQGVSLLFDMSRAHFFDPTTELALFSPGAF